MNFQVVWLPVTRFDLLDIWTASPNRASVTAAVGAIDRALAVNPDAVGRQRFDTVREYEHPPLGVEFEVIAASGPVQVLAVWETASGRPSPTGN